VRLWQLDPEASQGFAFSGPSEDTMTVLLGLDLSTRAAAAVAVPATWDGVWSRTTSIVVGEALRRDATDEERARRTETIAARLVAFASSQGATEAWIEGYAFSRQTAAHTLAELGGVVRLELVRAGVDVRTANISTARKLLLGRVPRQDAKAAAQSALFAAGAPRAWSADECDAFVACNFGLSETPEAFCFCTFPA
jgi:hypothetical protein